MLVELGWSPRTDDKEHLYVTHAATRATSYSESPCLYTVNDNRIERQWQCSIVPVILVHCLLSLTSPGHVPTQLEKLYSNYADAGGASGRGGGKKQQVVDRWANIVILQTTVLGTLAANVVVVAKERLRSTMSLICFGSVGCALAGFQRALCITCLVV